MLQMGIHIVIGRNHAAGMMTGTSSLSIHLISFHEQILSDDNEAPLFPAGIIR
jgi:hypothetical protein